MGGQQHLHCIKPKTRLIVSFTSPMVALIRRGVVPTESGSKSDQAFVTGAFNCGLMVLMVF